MLTNLNKIKAISHFFVVTVLVWNTVMPTAMAKETVTIFAASSLTNALSEISTQYQKQHDVRIRLSFASSSALARQIAYGAPADIYFPANQKWLNYVIEQNAVDARSRVTVLSNALVLIASSQSGIEPISPTIDKQWDLLSLLDGGRLALGDPAHVPVGLYAKQALQSNQQWDALVPHLARANNVRGALVLVERGESPLGVVYQTDAMMSKQVKALAAFTSESHDSIEYPMVMVSKTPSSPTVEFFEYLQTDDAKRVFVNHGFGVY
nr:molybdate ABC transporter substrate-binding protein [Vibrio amylolyticus]